MKRYTLIALTAIAFVVACGSGIKSPYYLAYMAHPLVFSAPNTDSELIWARGNEIMFNDYSEVVASDYSITGKWVNGDVTISRLVGKDSTVFKVKWSGYKKWLEPLAHEVAFYMATGKTREEYPAPKESDN